VNHVSDEPDPAPVIELLSMKRIVATALAEDIGYGDVTSCATVPRCAQAVGVVEMGAAGVVAGLPAAVEVFAQLDPLLKCHCLVQDGVRVERGDTIARVSGSARSMLTGERVALNFLQRLSGIATLTRAFVERIAGTKARITDTRKTTPGLRVLEKYAVRIGGGHNHRMDLSHAIMIKDNHIVASGGITQAVERVGAMIGHTMTITVECETLAQVVEALNAGADIVLLDNMDNETRAQAVRLVAGRAITEASGGVSLETVADVAATGVECISVGALTHSAPALDIRLNLAIQR
jgi:nicotinate-nucleotide pyrophosphorylase (carboxylating)